MRYINRILPWENRRRVGRLFSFREEVVKYFNNCEFAAFSVKENQEAQRLRTSINSSIDEIHEMILAAGISPRMTYRASPMAGGYVTDIDVVLNIFNLASYQVSPQTVTDHIERAYGKYRVNQKASTIRLFNPLFYLGLLIDLIAEIPFVILGKLGFNRARAESSLLGRIFKGFFQLCVFVATVFTILHYLGYMDSVKGLIKGH